MPPARAAAGGGDCGRGGRELLLPGAAPEPGEGAARHVESAAAARRYLDRPRQHGEQIGGDRRGRLASLARNAVELGILPVIGEAGIEIADSGEGGAQSMHAVHAGRNIGRDADQRSMCGSSATRRR